MTPYFYYLPKAVLAAIILVAVTGLIDIKEAKHLWYTDRQDFILFMATALATLVLGVEEGILVGVVLSIAMVIYQVSYPHVAELGRLPNSTEYRNVRRFDHLIENEQLLIIRFDAPLFFANLDFFTEYLKNASKNKPHLKHLILDFSAVNRVDSSALHLLHDLIERYKAKDIQVYFVDVKGPVRDAMKCSKLVEKLGESYFFLAIYNATEVIRGAQDGAIDKEIVLQSNLTSD